MAMPRLLHCSLVALPKDQNLHPSLSRLWYADSRLALDCRSLKRKLSYVIESSGDEANDGGLRTVDAAGVKPPRSIKRCAEMSWCVGASMSASRSQVTRSAEFSRAS